MTKTIIICALLAIVGFSAGYLTCQKVNTNNEIIELQKKALDKSLTVIDNNGLLDADGSDEMAEYLEGKSKSDSLYNIVCGQH
jgi:hypothetical protein